MTAVNTLPDWVDPELWFWCVDVPGAKDYLYDSHWHTHPGRMSAWCPSKQLSYRVSAGSVDGDIPAVTRYWVAGFLAGNLPARPQSDSEDSPEMRSWATAAASFAQTGQWNLPAEEHHAVLTNLSQVVAHHYQATDGPTWLVALALRFAEAHLVIEVDPGSDEVVSRLMQQPQLQRWTDDVHGRDVSTAMPWSGLLGTDAVWRWQLANQQGYRDGVQVELTKADISVTLQWIAESSRLQPRQVYELTRPPSNN